MSDALEVFWADRPGDKSLIGGVERAEHPAPIFRERFRTKRELQAPARHFREDQRKAKPLSPTAVAQFEVARKRGFNVHVAAMMAKIPLARAYWLDDATNKRRQARAQRLRGEAITGGTDGCQNDV